MTAQELRDKYLNFFKSKGHTIIPSASLIPENDPSVLFTTAGMHPLVPYLMGEKHPGGTRVANVQKCVRTSDIDDVGDNRHLTFFEMFGNWSFGDYFKKEAIEWSFEFLTDKKWLGLDPQRLYVTVFKGENGIPRDEESIEIWKNVFKEKANMEVEVAGDDEVIKNNARIIPLGMKDNFWIAGATGPCGGDTEMFYDVRSDDERKKEAVLTGKFSDIVDAFEIIEIWNDVFMEFNKTSEGKYEKLAKPNVDTGMGVERTLMVLSEENTVFETELFLPILKKIEKISGKHKYPSYSDKNEKSGKFPIVMAESQENKSFRIIADHIKASVFMIGDGITPSNVDRGYVLRRLLRRAIRHGKLLGIEKNFTKSIAEVVVEMYKDFYSELEKNKKFIFGEIEREEIFFKEALEKGLNEMERSGVVEISRMNENLKELKEEIGRINFTSAKQAQLDALKRAIDTNIKPMEKQLLDIQTMLRKTAPIRQTQLDALKRAIDTNIKPMEKQLLDIQAKLSFNLFQTFGFPFELTKEIGKERGVLINEKGFQKEFKKHQELSRTAAAGAFKGGLQSQDENTKKLHTATHLLQAALRQVLGTHVYQKGSNITAERLRFDFSHPEKMTTEEIKKVEDLVNEKIKANLEIKREEMTVEEAKAQGALGVFEAKYADLVSVYSAVGFSKEICGGPHVKSTGELGHFKITKEEASSAGVRRIKAILE